MKNISFLLLLFSTTFVLGQNRCGCDKDTVLKRYIDCDTILLKNNAKLYKQYDCDSLNMILENSAGIKYSVAGHRIPQFAYFVHLTPLLICDYDSSILILQNCTSMHEHCMYSLVDKENQNTRTFPNLVFYDSLQKFIVYHSHYDSLTIYFIQTEKEYKIKIPFLKPLSSIHELLFTSENLGKEPEFKNNILFLSYRYVNDGIKREWFEEKMEINISKYK